MARKTPEKKAGPASFLREGEFNLPELEEKVLASWDERHIFEKSIEKEPGAEKFIFYEGPPYANGKPAIHHVISRIVKDVILRYKTMKGYKVPRRAGWDTHGLPVEIATEKALGLKSKKDIEELGVKLFNEKAMEQVWIYKDEWERMTRRIGYWLDFKNAYVTYEPEYVESIWWTLSQIHTRGLLYKGFKVVPWCTRDGTSLSSHELAQGYKEVSDMSVYVKFKVRNPEALGYPADSIIYILSWTTTPWTLPGNVALAVGKNVRYVMWTDAEAEKGGVSYIASAHFFNKEQIRAAGPTEVPADQLTKLEYEPLFTIPSLVSERSYRIYPADFVTDSDGTGVVHTAVMYGEDDYALGKQVGLPEHHTVDEAGKFTKEVAGLAGQYVKAKETEENIFQHLRENGNLLRTEPYVHEYPFCWRCGTAILYYARSSWFIEMSKLREKLLENNDTVNWTPTHVKTGRFGEWLREAKDWNLSRERYWGAPLPIWECKACGHAEVVGGLDELDRLAGGSKNKYWAMRHGESENIIFKIVDSGDQNSHLTPNGKEQVARAANDLKKDKIDLIFASDLLRTKESAEIIADELGVPVHFDKRLREVNFGGLSGRPSIEIGKIFPTLESRFAGRVDEKSESYRDVRTRVWNFLEETEAKHHGKNILIVSHEDAIWMLAQAALGWSEKQAAAKKEESGGTFIKPAEVMLFGVKKIPRNDTGVVDIHRPFADEMLPPCPKCAAKMTRVPEVADVWYDSGAMPYAQAHYPFSVPKTDVKTLSGLDYPADYISEGMDQTRGWFYTLFAIAAALGYGAPYRNVIALGLINDKFGQKMSKSKGNIVEPFAVIDKYGVDALRWYFFTGSPLGEPKNFDEAEVGKAFRRVHLIVYNSFIFWKTYADQKAKLSDGPPNVLDEWILARLDQVSTEVSKRLDAYEIREAALEIETLVDDLSRWYIRRSRRRLQRPASDADYRAASATLGHVLLSLVAMMAPFTPFFSELFYGPLGGTRESVHLDEWPKPSRADRAAEEGATIVSQMAAVREFAAAGLALRAEKGIKVRQPLASMTVGVKLEGAIGEVLAEEMNVKEIRFVPELGGNVELDATITPALREEGLLREVARMFQELRQKAGLQPKDRIVAMMELPADAKDAIVNNEAAFMEATGANIVEHRRSDNFIAEEATKLDGQEAWVAVRKV